MISLIVPTHNRAMQLKECLESIEALSGETEFEVIVVLNNCDDNSSEIAADFSRVRAVSEPATAFSKARDVGAEHAAGDVLVFMDDDALLRPGTLKRINKIMQERTDCGILAGKIESRFAAPPPRWVDKVQRSKNGLSLYNPVQSDDPESVWEVDGACGPLMAIRKSVYREVGGFPPDTLGVETNRGEKVFSKIYVGPGDYGITQMVKATGARVLFSPGVSVWHVIPKFRLTTSFWASRYFGEGCYLAISDREFWQLPTRKLLLKLLVASMTVTLAAAVQRIGVAKKTAPYSDSVGRWDLTTLESLAYLSVASLLFRNPNLGPKLWNAAKNGISNGAFDSFVDSLPDAFLTLTSIPWEAAVVERMPLANLIDLLETRKILGFAGIPKLMKIAGQGTSP